MALPYLSQDQEYASGIDAGADADKFGITLPGNIATMSPLEKADLYNQFIQQGFTDPQIRGAVTSQFGSQSDQDWSALTGLARDRYSPPASLPVAAPAPAAAALPTAAAGVTQQAFAPKTPKEALDFALKNPNQVQELGQFTVAPISEGSRLSGAGLDLPPEAFNWTPEAYEVTGLTGKTDKGVDYESILNYSPTGDLNGYQVKYKTGSDSGYIVNYDAAGNPVGQPIQYDDSEGWRRPAGLAVSLIGATFGAPYVGQLLGATAGSTAASLLGGAALGGAGAAISGAEGSDLIKGAALGAAGAGAGKLAADVGGALQKAVPGLGGEILSGAATGAIQALPGAIASGDASQLGIGALTGGATAAFSEAMTNLGLSRNQIQGAANVITEFASGKPNINTLINAAGQLIDTPNAAVGAKAAVMLNQVASGAGPAALMAAAQDLYSAIQYAAEAPTRALEAEAAKAGQAFPAAGPMTQEQLEATVAQNVRADQTLKIGAGQADDIDQAAALASSRGYSLFEFPAGSGNVFSTSDSGAELEAANRRFVEEERISKLPDYSSVDSLADAAMKAYTDGNQGTFLYKGTEYRIPDAIDIATAQATGLPVLQMGIPKVTIDWGPGGGRGSYTGWNAADYAANIAKLNAQTTAPTDTGLDYSAIATSMEGTPLSDEFKPTVKTPKWMHDHLVSGGNFVQQGLSNIMQLVGEQGSSLVTALGGRNTFLDRMFTALETGGKNIELPQVTQATNNVIERVEKAEGGLFSKAVELVKAAYDNPLSANVVFREVGQELLPIGLAAKAAKVFGLVAGAATDVIMNSLESVGATSREKYAEYRKQGFSEEQADRKAEQDGYKAGFITAITGGIADAAIVKKFGSAIENFLERGGRPVAATGRGVGATTKEGISEGFEEALIEFATGGDINSILTKAVIGGAVGAKTSGTIQASVDVNAGLAQAFNEQGLVSINGTYKPDSLISNSTVIGLDPQGAKVTLGNLVDASLSNPSSALSTTGQLNVNQLIQDYTQTILGGQSLNTSMFAGNPVVGTNAAGSNITITDLGVVPSVAPKGSVSSSGSDVSVANDTVKVDASGGSSEIKVDGNTISSGEVANDTSKAVSQGGDAASIVAQAGDAAKQSGADSDAATQQAINGVKAAGADVTITDGKVQSNQTVGNIQTQTVVDTNTNQTTSQSTNTKTGEVTNSVTNADGQSQSTTQGVDTSSVTASDSKTGVSITNTTDLSGTSNVVTDSKSGVKSETKIDASTGSQTQITTDTTNGVKTEVKTDASSGVTSSKESDPGSGVTVTSETNPSTDSSTTSVVDATSGVNTNITTNNSTGTTVVTENDTSTGVTTQSKTDAANNVTTQTVTDGDVSTETVTDASTGVTSQVTTDTKTGVTTETTTDVSTGVTSQVTTDATANVVTQTTTDVSAGVNTQTTTDASTGVTTETQTDINSGVTTQVHTDATAGITTETVTDVNSGITVQTQTDLTTGITTETQTDVNTGVTTQVTTDVNTGVITETIADTNTGVVVQVTTDAETTTETKTNLNTGVTTQVTTDTNTGVTTQVTTNPNTGVTTMTTTNNTVEVTTTIDTNTNTQTTVVVDVNTGDIVDLEETEITLDIKLDPVAPVEPVKPLDPISSVTAIDPVEPVKPTATAVSTAPKPKIDAQGAMMLPSAVIGSGRESIDPQFLKSVVTQGYIDPLAGVKQAQAELQGQDLMQQVDPRLAAILQERMGQQQQQEQESIGALAKMLSGEASNTPYYSYGEEDSIDDILGGKAAGFAQGGYVAPLQMADGGDMPMPLMAKEGGRPREDFRDGKHVAGDGDGQSDDIPAWLADGEFVFPADVVSALGNGSTKAGTDKLYEMMHEIRKRARSTDHEDLPPPALKSPLDYLKSKR